MILSFPKSKCKNQVFLSRVSQMGLTLPLRFFEIYYFSPVLLWENWHTAQCKFKVYNIMTWLECRVRWLVLQITKLNLHQVNSKKISLEIRTFRIYSFGGFAGGGATPGSIMWLLPALGVGGPAGSAQGTVWYQVSNPGLLNAKHTSSPLSYQ